MARNRPCVVMAWAAFVLPLTLIGADADEQEDREAIRALFHQEQEGHRLSYCQKLWIGRACGYDVDGIKEESVSSG